MAAVVLFVSGCANPDRDISNQTVEQRRDIPTSAPSVQPERAAPAAEDRRLEGRFYERVKALEELVAGQPLSNTTKRNLRTQLDFLVDYLEAANTKAERLALLRRQLQRVRDNSVGVVQGNPALYEAYMRALKEEEQRILNEIKELQKEGQGGQ